MYKLIYWSQKAQKVKVVMFGSAKDCADYFWKNHDDMDLDNHFVKIVKE